MNKRFLVFLLVIALMIAGCSNSDSVNDSVSEPTQVPTVTDIPATSVPTVTPLPTELPYEIELGINDLPLCRSLTDYATWAGLRNIPGSVSTSAFPGKIVIFWQSFVIERPDFPFQTEYHEDGTPFTECEYVPSSSSPESTVAQYVIVYGPGDLPLCIENILGYPMSIGATGFVAELMDFLSLQPAIKWLNGIESTDGFPFEVVYLEDDSPVTYCENE